MRDADGARVVAVERCALSVIGRPWPFADGRREEIDAHWQRRTVESAAFFNGRIYMLADHDIRGGVLSGALFPVEFKSFLYWKETGAPDRSVFDAFGSALIRARDGAILLGRQRAGNVNDGLFYLPGGFIDANDVDAGGRVDLRASVLREVAEETGLAPARLTVRPGYRVTLIGQQVSVAVELVSDAEAAALVALVHERVAADRNGELEEVVAVRDADDLARYRVPGYARAVVRSVLDGGRAPA